LILVEPSSPCKSEPEAALGREQARMERMTYLLIVDQQRGKQCCNGNGFQVLVPSWCQAWQAVNTGNRSRS